MIPLDRIVGRAPLGNNRGTPNRFKNFGGPYSTPILPDIETTQAMMAKLFDYLENVGANPKWGLNGQLAALDPMNIQKMTTSIWKLRRWFPKDSSIYNDPLWNYAINLGKAVRSYASGDRLYRKYGNPDNIYQRKRYNAEIRLLRKGMYFANVPGALEKYRLKYSVANSKAKDAFKKRYDALSQANTNAANYFVNTYGQGAGVDSGRSILYAPTRSMLNRSNASSNFFTASSGRSDILDSGMYE